MSIYIGNDLEDRLKALEVYLFRRLTTVIHT